MTIEAIHRNFKIVLDKNAQAAAYGGCPAFLPEEEDLWLMQGYYEVLSNKFTGTNANQEAFEGSVKRIADLEKLIRTDTDQVLSLDSSSNVLTLTDFFKTADNTNNRMFFVDAVLHFGNNRSVCTLVDHTTAKKFLKTYNNNPWIDTPVATLQDNQLKIFIDTYKMAAPYKLDITYVKHPEVIDYRQGTKDITEVPDSVMYEIINRAAVLALENIESKRVETKLQINNLQE